MKRLFLALLVTAAGVLPVCAQEYMVHKVTGTVVAADRDSLVLDTSTGRMTFKLDSALDRLRYDSLRTGTTVEVTHKLADQGNRQMVTAVNVLSEPQSRPYDATLDKTGNQTGGTAPVETYAAADARRDENGRLPATATPFGAIALLCLVAVFGGLTLRAYSKGTRLN